jgi:hypothetical protein
MSYVRVFSPDTESELAVVVAMLEAHGISCFTHGRNIGSIYPGIQINAFNTQNVMVPEEQVQDALELIRQFREAAPARADSPTMSWRDKLRIIFEVLLLGWFVPGHKAAKDNRK